MSKLTDKESRERYEAAWDTFEYFKKRRRDMGLPELPQDEMPMVELLAEAGEETYEDLDISGVYGAMYRHKSLKKALDDYPDVTFEQFKENVVRVIGGYKSWEEFAEKAKGYLDVK